MRKGQGLDMRAIAGLVVFITILAGLIALPGTASAKPAGDNAFLIDSADNVKDLVGQVEDSRLLVLRYAKFYKVDPSTVLTYFKNELSVEKLTEDVTLDVHQRKGTDFESNSEKFKAGTKVFVNKNGIPILELGTGNPLTDSLPGKDVKKLPTTPESGVSPTNAQPPQAVTNPTEVAQPPADPTTVVDPVPPTVEVANSTLPTATVPGPTTTSPLAVPTEPTSAVLSSGPIETVTRGGGSRLGGWILPVGLAGALLGAGSGGGSPAAPNTEPIIPEPAGLLALGTGLVSLAGMSYRRIRIR